MNEIVSPQEVYERTDHLIHITVTPHFLEEQSHPGSRQYLFQYSIVISNHRAKSVQLINRHWRVFSGVQQIADVKGEGVVGEQPVLAPGKSHQYSSYSVIHEPYGKMNGSFTFVTPELEWFDVDIPEFHLIYIDPLKVM